MIQVLHIGLSDKIGGIEIFLKNITTYINREEFHFDFISFSTVQPFRDEFVEMGCNVFDLPSVKHIFRYLKVLREIIKNGNYDIVHIHKNSCANIIPFFVCKRLGIKFVIAHSHNTSSNFGIVTNVIHYINRPIMNKLCDCRFACSKVAVKWLFGNKFECKSTLINNGINFRALTFQSDNRKSIRYSIDADDDCLVMLHVGRFVNQKNHTFLIDVLEQVVAKNKNVKLIMIGKGDLENQVFNKIVEKGLSNYVIHIPETKEVVKYLSASDVFLFPSLYEGLCIALLEAQANGLQVLASDKISEETKLLPGLQFLKIEDAIVWSEKILQISTSMNENRTVNELAFDLYDIKKVVVKLTKIYQEGAAK